MNPTDQGDLLADDVPMRRILDPVERMPRRRIPLSTWCVFAATALFLWAYLAVNKQHIALSEPTPPQLTQ